mmetsp:Transcript_93871/g.297953  ORF Transcript_93871/g.297953 Transcript_93871/m.297953 type:complete len:450 (-) Transcript_93871:64-1413(-)
MFAQGWWTSCSSLCKAPEKDPLLACPRPWLKVELSKKQEAHVRAEEAAEVVLDEKQKLVVDSLIPIHVHPDFRIYDIKVAGDNRLQRGLQQYHNICREHVGLLVTTSCFSTWLKARKTNGSAKLIPAIPSSSGNLSDITRSPLSDCHGKAVRVFFFDDNINLHLGGSSDIDGICNLRDVSTGAYVNFSAGENGFEVDHAYQHTVIHHSTQYRNTLVQANILDAMANTDYFLSIIKRYSEPGEKLIVFFDVNGTLLWDDTVSNKGMAEVLLSTMFRFTEVRPREPCDFSWEGRPPVRLEKQVTLRQLVSEISNKDSEYYARFWNQDTCSRFLQELSAQADLGWLNDRSSLTQESFLKTYQEYLRQLHEHVSEDGITNSWGQVWDYLRNDGHLAVLNSFGIDTHRVVARSVPDGRQVLYITIDYNLWGQKDLLKWSSIFERHTDRSQKTRV